MFVTHNVLYANLSVQFVALPNADLCFPNTSSLRCHDTHFYKVAQRIIRSLDLGTDRRTTSHEPPASQVFRNGLSQRDTFPGVRPWRRPY